MSPRHLAPPSTGHPRPPGVQAAVRITARLGCRRCSRYSCPAPRGDALKAEPRSLDTCPLLLPLCPSGLELKHFTFRLGESSSLFRNVTVSDTDTLKPRGSKLIKVRTNWAFGKFMSSAKEGD